MAAVVTIPLVFLVVTLIIPILFFIIAIMMFARRNKVETVPAYYNDDYGQPYYDEREYYDHHEPHSRPRDDYYERTIIKVITMNMNNHETKRKIEIQEDNLEKNVDKRSI